jgi:hypothetical protein
LCYLFGKKSEGWGIRGMVKGRDMGKKSGGEKRKKDETKKQNSVV